MEQLSRSRQPLVFPEEDTPDHHTLDRAVDTDHGSSEETTSESETDGSSEADQEVVVEGADVIQAIDEVLLARRRERLAARRQAPVVLRATKTSRLTSSPDERYKHKAESLEELLATFNPLEAQVAAYLIDGAPLPADMTGLTARKVCARLAGSLDLKDRDRLARWKNLNNFLHSQTTEQPAVAFIKDDIWSSRSQAPETKRLSGKPAFNSPFAKCGDQQELFYVRPGVSSSDAQALCAECVVSEACLEFALENHEDKGVWGGKTRNQRREILQQRAAALEKEKAEKGTPVVGEDNANDKAVSEQKTP